MARVVDSGPCYNTVCKDCTASSSSMCANAMLSGPHSVQWDNDLLLDHFFLVIEATSINLVCTHLINTEQAIKTMFHHVSRQTKNTFKGETQ